MADDKKQKSIEDIEKELLNHANRLSKKIEELQKELNKRKEDSKLGELKLKELKKESDEKSKLITSLTKKVSYYDETFEKVKGKILFLREPEVEVEDKNDDEEFFNKMMEIVTKEANSLYKIISKDVTDRDNKKQD